MAKKLEQVTWYVHNLQLTAKENEVTTVDYLKARDSYNNASNAYTEVTYMTYMLYLFESWFAVNKWTNFYWKYTILIPNLCDSSHRETGDWNLDSGPKWSDY